MQAWQPALELKLRVIAETLYELGKMRSDSRRELAQLAGVNYNRLKAAWASGRLSTDLQMKLAEVGGFEASDPTWIDHNVLPLERSKSDNTDYPGQDTIQKFKMMIRRCHRLTGTETIRVANQRPRLIDSNLATFTVEDSGQGTTSNGSVQMFFTIVLNLGYHSSGFAYGFRRVRLK
jgi:hypothetical protein